MGGSVAGLKVRVSGVSGYWGKSPLIRGQMSKGLNTNTGCCLAQASSFACCWNTGPAPVLVLQPLPPPRALLTWLLA